MSNFLFSESNIQIKVLNPALTDVKVSYSEIKESMIKIVVLDKNDQPIEGLTKKDISLICNGNSADIISMTPLSELSNAKYNVVLCLDNSSSMNTYSDDLLLILTKFKKYKFLHKVKEFNFSRYYKIFLMIY